jgi:hypothetical protein
MIRLLLILLTVCLVTACGTHLQPYGTSSPARAPYWESPSRADVNRPKDDLECSAMAVQAASGAGGWTSVAPMRDAIYQQARQNYYNQCVQSRGYTWVTPR